MHHPLPASWYSCKTVVRRLWKARRSWTYLNYPLAGAEIAALLWSCPRINICCCWRKPLQSAGVVGLSLLTLGPCFRLMLHTFKFNITKFEWFGEYAFLTILKHICQVKDTLATHSKISSYSIVVHEFMYIMSCIKVITIAFFTFSHWVNVLKKVKKVS